MQNKTLIKLGLGAILSVALIAGYYGCGGGGSSSSSGSSAPLYSTGVLDTTFGTGGVVTTTSGTGDDEAKAIVMQSDGKIIIAGYYFNGVENDFGLVRYTITGTLDTTFGTGGVVTTTIILSNDDRVNSMVLQSDNKIVIAGYSYNGVDNDFALVRYNSNGSLDTTFDTDGVVTTTIGSGDDIAFAIALQTDGKIIVAGQYFNGVDDDFALARYNTNGSLDTAFGGDGVVTTTIGSVSDACSAITVQSDGKIVVAGSYHNGSNNKFALARYTSAGALDTTFDTDGVVTTTIGSNSDMAHALALQSDGKIVVAGRSFTAGSNYNFAIVRYNTNGSLDATFDADGVVTTSIGSGDDVCRAITLQSDGKIMAAGYSRSGTDDDFALVRYNTNGSLDTAFGTSGVATTAIGIDNDYISAIALQSDNKIVVAGHSNSGVDYDFTLARYWR